MSGGQIHRTHQGRSPGTAHVQAGECNDPVAEGTVEALDRLLRKYQPIAIGYLVRRFLLTEDEAYDCWQGFVLDRVLRGRILERAQPNRGSFTGFLLRALCNYAIDQVRRRNTAKNAPDQPMLPLEEVAEDDLPGTGNERSEEHELSWTRAAIAGALLDMHQDCIDSGQERLWKIFEGRVLTPILQGDPPVTYSQFSGPDAYPSPTQAANGLVTSKRVFKRHLNHVFGEYAQDQPEFLAEVDLLRRCLAQRNVTAAA